MRVPKDGTLIRPMWPPAGEVEAGERAAIAGSIRAKSARSSSLNKKARPVLCMPIGITSTATAISPTVSPSPFDFEDPVGHTGLRGAGDEPLHHVQRPRSHAQLRRR